MLSHSLKIKKNLALSTSAAEAGIEACTRMHPMEGVFQRSDLPPMSMTKPASGAGRLCAMRNARELLEFHGCASLFESCLRLLGIFLLGLLENSLGS